MGDPTLNTIITEGKDRGKRRLVRKCCVSLQGGELCGVDLSWLNPAEVLKGSTTPITRHIRYYATKDEPEPGHAAVWSQLCAGGSKNMVEVDGKVVAKMAFGEAFP